MNKEHLEAALDGIEEPYINIICGENRGKLLKRTIDDINKATPNVEEVTPPPNLIFNAFKLCKFNDLKCVIIGQDPYPKKGDAVGLSFSAPRDKSVPQSLKKIYSCLVECGEIETTPSHPDLTNWARQGVLLLNLTLTTRIGASQAHASYWKDYANAMIMELSRTAAASGKQLVWMLWGLQAQSVAGIIRRGAAAAIGAGGVDAGVGGGNNAPIILEWGHPSPLNNSNKTDNPANFKYCDHFHKVNALLSQHALRTIDWDPDCVV